MTLPLPAKATAEHARPSWQQATAPFQRPDWRRSAWQLADTLIPYLALWYLMYRSLALSYWLTLLLAIPTGGFLIRTFIIFHDCGHGAFFKSPRANAVAGTLAGFFTFTPYYQWRHEHAVHHATSGDLDRRGVGDVWTLTVREYRALPPGRRLIYRFFRNPFVMFGLGPLAIFLLIHRLPGRNGGRRERASALGLDAALLVLWALMALTIGLRAYVLVQLPTLLIGGATGIWLFYVQHQFQGVRWMRHADWDFYRAALEGSSFYRLPRVLQWFTGNIGYHHIHHLNSRIPNYNLAKCHRENPMFQQVITLTLVTSLRSLFLRLWDEERGRLVGFTTARD